MTRFARIAGRLDHLARRLRIARAAAAAGRRRTVGLREEIEAWAVEAPEATLLVDKGGTIDRAGFVAGAARVARWAIVNGAALEPGGVGARVAVLMPSGAEAAATLAGLAMAGAIAVPCSAALAPDGVAACLNATKPRLIVLSPATLYLFEAAVPRLQAAAQVWVYGTPHLAYQRLDEAVAALSGDRLERLDRRALLPTTTALRLASTGDGRSGTVPVSHRRLVVLAHALAAGLRLDADDEIHLAADADPVALLLATLAAGVAKAAVRLLAGAPDTEATVPDDRPGQAPSDLRTIRLGLVKADGRRFAAAARIGWARGLPDLAVVPRPTVAPGTGG